MNPIRLLALLPFLGLLAVPMPGNPPKPARPAEDPAPKTLHLSFGVYQTDKATEMYKAFTPLLEALQDDLTKRLGRPVDLELKIFHTYDDGINALVAGNVDFVHFGPASYVTAKAREDGIRLLAMEFEGNREKRFKGVIVVGKQSPIRTIEDLKGKRFAFGDPNSTIGRYLVQAELVENHIHARDLADFKYLERHDQVAAAVEHGDFDAGSVKFSTFQKANERGTLRALAVFWNVTKPLVARKGLDEAVFDAIRQSLITLEDPSVLKAMKVAGFMEASDDDYQMVRDGMKKSEEFDTGMER
jgi:phosphonate transport system substrate-binding protein